VTCERRGGRCPVAAPTVAVCPAGRLRCAARSEGAPGNSLHSLRSLRSTNPGESDERSALRAPPSALRCSPPHKSPPPGTAHRAAPPVVLVDACHQRVGKAVGRCASAATYAAPRRRARTGTVQWTVPAWRAAGPQGSARPARRRRMAARASAHRHLTRRDCLSGTTAGRAASFSAGRATEHHREPLAQRGAAASERRRTPARGFAALTRRTRRTTP
jgi:hypothetical protein